MDFTNELCRRTEECLSLFQDATRHQNLADDDWFEDRAADFAWWSYGLKAQKTGRSSLDYRLRSRPDIRNVIADLLDSLALALKEYLQPGRSVLISKTPRSSVVSDINEVQGSLRDDRSDGASQSDKSSSGSSWSEFSDEAKQSKDKDALIDTPDTEDSDPRFYIETNVKLLAKISIAIRRSGAKLRYFKADMYLKDHHDDDEYTQLRSHLLFVILIGPYEQKLFIELGRRAINQQIPKAVEIVIRSWIVDPSRATSNQQRLIEANITRRNRIAYARRFIGKSTLPSKRQEAPAPTIVPSQLPEVVSEPIQEPSTFEAEAQEPFPIADPIQLPPNLPEPTESLTAKTLTATELGSQFVLPVIIPFEPKKGAMSVATKMTQTGIKQDYPACPGKKGSFQCPYCVQVLSEDYTARSRWRGHVAQDLNPYSCVYEDCQYPSNLYATKEEWAKHMRSQHSQHLWACDDCIFESDQDDEFIFDSQELWESHMRSHHSCQDDRLTLLCNMSKRDLTQLVKCPLCKRPCGNSRPDQDDHIAEHLHAWALRALPWDLNPDDEASSDSPEMGSENDLARMSDMSERTEDDVDSIVATTSDAIKRELTLWIDEDLIVTSRLFGLIEDLKETIVKWTARTRLDTENEITLQHLINIGQTRTQLGRESEGGLKESEFTTQQQQDIQDNLCAKIEVGMEYMSGVLGADNTEPDQEPSFSPFAKLKGDNIPPDYGEKKKILCNERRAVQDSKDISKQIAWARDVLTWTEISEDSLTMEYGDSNRSQPPQSLRDKMLRIDAVKIITDLSQQENPEALYNYSKWLEFGKFDNPVDKRQAFAGYKRAAELGHGRSEYRMGMLFEQSNDISKAKEHYHRGISLKDSAALYRMGMMSLLGQHDEPRDRVTGLERIKAAADNPDEDAPQAPYVYGMLLARELPEISIPEDLLPNDLALAKRYVEKSAYLGFAKAQVKIGQAYEFCQFGCEFNPAYSLHYYRLAACQGDPEAAMGLSRWFLCEYEGVIEKDEALAYKYAQLAAKAELPTAEFALGYYNEIGVHVEKDLAEARKWYQIAADHGSKEAVTRLESLEKDKPLDGSQKMPSLNKNNASDEKPEAAPLVSGFPKVTGANIPPTDDEKEDALIRKAAEGIPNSNDPALQLAWVRDVVSWATIAQKVRRRKPDSQQAPDTEQQLKDLALDIMRRLVTKEYPEALYHHGKWIELGPFGHEVNLWDATSIYRLSAEGGCARAEYRLGKLHQQSEEWEAALAQYEKAASLGDSAASCQLGLILLLPSHRERPDVERGLTLLQQSADSADEDAPQGAYVYGMVIARELEDFTVDESLLPTDKKWGFSYIEKSAYLGHAKAQLKMGKSYEQGLLGCPRDLPKALHYYHLAARQGSAEAAYTLSYWFEVGMEGVLAPNLKLSLKFARWGASEGHAGAEYMMGRHYERAKRDLYEARKWYDRAAHHGWFYGRNDKMSKAASERLRLLFLGESGPKYVDRPPLKLSSKATTIVVGIDLGAMFSSVSWADSAKPRWIYTIQNWPTSDAIFEPNGRVPTQCELKTGVWGNPKLQAARLRKSSKAPQETPFSVFEDLSSRSGEVQTKAVEFITVYLEALWKHAATAIFSKTESQIGDFTITLSVPVNLSWKAQNRLRRAARIAMAPHGTSQVVRINLVRQMEASIFFALTEPYRLDKFTKGPDIMFQNGDMIICDCGGTSARAISYEIVANSPPLVHQLTSWNREVYGKHSVDMEFIDYLFNHSGSKFSTSTSAKDELDRFIQKEWEYGLKRTFRGDEKSDISIELSRMTKPTLERLGRSTKTLLIKRDTLQKLFEKSVTAIEQVIAAQFAALEALGRKPNSILLVGGLAQSPYIIHHLHQKFDRIIRPRADASPISQGVVSAELERLQGNRLPELAELEG